MFIPFLQGKELSFVLDNTSNLFVVLSSLSLFYLIRAFFEQKKIPTSINHKIHFIASTTFGIYLIHFLLYYMVYYRILGIYQISPEFGTIITTLSTFIIGCIITTIGKKIPILKNFL